MLQGCQYSFKRLLIVSFVVVVAGAGAGRVNYLQLNLQQPCDAPQNCSSLKPEPRIPPTMYMCRCVHLVAFWFKELQPPSTFLRHFRDTQVFWSNSVLQTKGRASRSRCASQSASLHMMSTYSFSRQRSRIVQNDEALERVWHEPPLLSSSMQSYASYPLAWFIRTSFHNSPIRMLLSCGGRT